MSETSARERPKRPTSRTRTKRPTTGGRPPRARRSKPKRVGPGRLTRAGRHVKTAVSTPRGALLTLAVAVVVVGIVGFALVLNAESGTPRLGFDDASGSASEIRARVLESTRDGDVSKSLAPGLGAQAADALADAPIYFVSAFATAAQDEATVIESLAVTERITFVNTSAAELDVVRFNTAAPLSGAGVADLEAGADADDARLSGTLIVADLARPLEPGDQAVVELHMRLTPQRLKEASEIGDVLAGGGDTGPAAQLTRRNLVYLIDWYPRLARLGPGGWEDGPTDIAAFDTTGSPSVAYLDVDLPSGWQITAGGTRLREDETDDRMRQRYVLAGSRALPLVAMRNALESDVSQGVYRASGVSLDTFEPTLDDAVEQALFAKATLSDEFESTMWRDTVVVGLALRGTPSMLTADNVVFLDQTLLTGGPSDAGPGSQTADYRQAVFEGVSAEWWGGRTDIDGWRLPAYVDGLRTWSAALVWGAIGGDGLERLSSTQTLATPYRQARDAGEPDVSASFPFPAYATVQSLTIAQSKVGLTQPGAAIGLKPDATSDQDAVDEIAGSALVILNADMFSVVDEAAVVDAYAEASGRPLAETAEVVEAWLSGVNGDAEIGLDDGGGSIPLYTDASGASRDLTGTSRFAVDTGNITGFGEGWTE